MTEEFKASEESASRNVDWFRNLIIYDVGMNTGQDTDYYLKKGFKVVAIEANPSLCESAEKKFRPHLDSGQLKILNLGVSDQRGSMEFYVNEEHSEWSSFHESIAGRAGHKLNKIHVQVATMNDVIEKEGVPYYLKIDIEGNDLEALRSALEGDHRIPYVSVENGSTMLPMLHGFDYTRFKYIQQNSVHLQQQAYPAKEGLDVDHTFEFGASGKFGEETDGEWLDYDATCQIVNRVWDIETGAKNPEWDDAVGGWFDLHARHDQYKNSISALIGKV